MQLVELIPLSKLKLNPDNPRTIDKVNFERLKASIGTNPKFLEYRPIVINKDFMILGGNQRFKALKELGFKDIPSSWVKQADDWTEQEEEDFELLDNSHFGKWDFDALSCQFDVEELEAFNIIMPDLSLIDDVEDEVKEASLPSIRVTFFNIEDMEAARQVIEDALRGCECNIK